MAKASKGQAVKRFKDTVPQPDQSSVEQITVVYFAAGDGEFRIYVPEHISQALPQDLTTQGYVSTVAEPHVKDATQQGVLTAWTKLKERYLGLLRREGAVKVIRYAVRAQHPGQATYGDRFSFEYSHLGPGVALQLDWEVLWRSGDRLFYGRYEGDELHLQDKGPVPVNAYTFEKYRLIEWTEEREAFFQAMKDGLISLIERLIVFCRGDVETQIAQIMSGAASNPLLPAPTKEDA